MNTSSRAFLAVVFASAFISACTKGRGQSSQEEQLFPGAVPSASVAPVSIANAFGTCDDVAACDTACEAGAGDQCVRLGATYEFGKNDAGQDGARGTAYYDRACALGNASGCVSAGRMHEYGHGVPKDFPVAAAAYEKACTSGWQVGCANWAIMLENGRGVPKDLEKARTLYAGACKAGAGLACERLKVLERDAG